MAKYIPLDALVAEIEKLKLCTMDEHMKFYSEAAEAEYNALEKVLEIMNSFQEEPKSYDLVKFADCASVDYRKQRESCDLKDPIALDEVEEANYSGIMDGANWQKEQMMAKAVKREVKQDAGGYPYIDATELYDYDKDIPLAKAGDKVKVIILKDS